MATQNAQNSATTIPVGTWTVEPTDSRIGFAVKNMWGLATVRGQFDQFHGTLVSQEHAVDGELSIDTASINTKNGTRDKHLRSGDFFDAERYPAITFTTTAITEGPKGLTITGDLRIGVTQLHLELPVTVERPDGRLVLGTSTTVAREDAGLAWNRVGMVGRDANLTLELSLVRAG